TGSIDEVRVSMGMLSDTAGAKRAGNPVPPPGPVGRFVNRAGGHYPARTTDPVVGGCHLEGALALPAAPAPHTPTLYACRSGAGRFTSVDAACEGNTVLGTVGLVYTIQPTNIPTVPVYRCTATGDSFESLRSDCEGVQQHSLLGYTVAYASLARYYE